MFDNHWYTRILEQSFNYSSFCYIHENISCLLASPTINFLDCLTFLTNRSQYYIIMIVISRVLESTTTHKLLWIDSLFYILSYSAIILYHELWLNTVLQIPVITKAGYWLPSTSFLSKCNCPQLPLSISIVGILLWFMIWFISAQVMSTWICTYWHIKRIPNISVWGTCRQTRKWFYV